MATTLAILILVAPLPSVGIALQAPATVTQVNDLRAFDGEWIYVEDRTEGRSLEQLGPPMSARISMRTEAGAVILVSGHGSGHRNVRLALDGSATEVPGVTEGAFARYRGAWKGNVFSYEVEFVRGPGKEPEGAIRRELRITNEGLLISASNGTALYRHPQDIPMPAPAKASIGDMAWLANAWVGTRGTGGTISFEERWSAPLGGAMLATSRTVSRGRMSAFEFLQIVERDGGLVYIAQPNGGAPTDFVLTELSAKRAVFDNPRHDYPKRIVYELSAEGSLTASIGFMKGGSPRRFEYKREGA